MPCTTPCSRSCRRDCSLSGQPSGRSRWLLAVEGGTEWMLPGIRPPSVTQDVVCMTGTRVSQQVSGVVGGVNAETSQALVAIFPRMRCVRCWQAFARAARPGRGTLPRTGQAGCELRRLRRGRAAVPRARHACCEFRRMRRDRAGFGKALPLHYQRPRVAVVRRCTALARAGLPRGVVR